MLLGDGVGGFAPPIHTTLPWRAQRLDAGDVDGDGLTDLAVSLYLQDAVALLHGFGDGSFAPLVTRPAAPGPSDVELCDVDADGDLDVLAVGRISAELTVILGGGDGTLGGPFSTNLGQDQFFLETAHLDGDSHLDVVLTGFATVQVLHGTGVGSFTFGTTLSFPSSQVQLADVDQDGDVDVHAMGYYASCVYLNDGSGSFPTSSYTGHSVRAAARLVDLGDDGVMDLVAVHPRDYLLDDAILIYTWNGTAFEQVYGLVLGDFNDLGTFPCLTDIGCSYVPIYVRGTALVEDFDLDGDLDLASAEFEASGRRVRFHAGTPGGGFDGTQSSDLSDAIAWAELRDMDRDGFLDLVGARFGEIRWFRGDGSGGFGAQLVSPSTGLSTYDWISADLDGDGARDFALANRDSDDVGVLLGSPLADTFVAAPRLAIGNDPLRIDAGDANGDGVLDLAVGSRFPSMAHLFLGNGDGTFQVPWAQPSGATPTIVRMVDLDGDGVLDLVTNGSSTTLDVWGGVGDGTFLAPTSHAVGIAPDTLGVGDFDDDGITDLVVSALFSGSSILLGQPGGGFSVSPVALGGRVEVVDVTGDGDEDLLFHRARAFLRGFGDGTFSSVAAIYGPKEGTTVGDVNGDGAPDVIGIEGVGLSVMFNRLYE